ncbi:MAG: antibiotic biosynthesis monooxygenase family protein [Gemmatimonadota bacterium]|jgi:quinol monooxygenase YgiN|nr:antibiotic biosynthesis monooxygenase family protein [Gemmatimonadota bacterium]
MPEKMILEIPVKADKRDEFLTALDGALPDTKAYEGNIKTEVWLPEDDDSLVLIYEEWATRANQEAYFNWRIETGMMDAMAPFFAGEPRVVWLQER